MENSKQKNTTIFAGVSSALSINQPNTEILAVQNSSGEDMEMTAISVRYKAGLEKVLIKIETPNSKNDPIVLGELALGSIGTPYGTPGYARFFIPGKKPILKSGQALKIYAQTFSDAILDRDISVLVDGQSLKDE